MGGAVFKSGVAFKQIRHTFQRNKKKLTYAGHPTFPNVRLLLKKIVNLPMHDHIKQGENTRDPSATQRP